jgi:hypothetical protein
MQCAIGRYKEMETLLSEAIVRLELESTCLYTGYLLSKYPLSWQFIGTYGYFTR